ncbi:hypothetical protein [Thalassotalea maritima]|uniref:hypothetical protein n=1 Tax=Thalassotalea maritima TaxID=3242416 RepID=UPI00352708F9
MSKLTKVSVLSLLAGSFMALNSAAAVDMDDIHKQLDIMGNIMQDSANQVDGNKRHRVSRVDSHYLAGQGVLFTLSMNASRFADFPVAPVVPVPPVGESGEALFGEGFEVVIEQALEDAALVAERVNDGLRQQLEEQRTLREQERELAYAMRDLARQERDLKYQKLHVEKQQKQELKQQLEKIEQKKAEIAESKQAIEAQNKQYREKVAALKQQRLAEKQQFLHSLEQNLAQVMCRYGGGLRQIPDEQYVSVIIKGAGEQQRQGNKDKVIVFKKADIKSCVLESIDSKALLSKANSYQY